MSHETSQFNNEQNNIALNSCAAKPAINESRHIEDEWAVAIKDMGLGHLLYGVVAKSSQKLIVGDLTAKEAASIVIRWNSQPALLDACKYAARVIRRQEVGMIQAEAVELLKAAIAQAEKEG